MMKSRAEQYLLLLEELQQREDEVPIKVHAHHLRDIVQRHDVVLALDISISRYLDGSANQRVRETQQREEQQRREGAHSRKENHKNLPASSTRGLTDTLFIVPRVDRKSSFASSLLRYFAARRSYLAWIFVVALLGLSSIFESCWRVARSRARSHLAVYYSDSPWPVSS